MGGCFSLFYYQYSTSGGGVQEKSPILRHQYEILNNPAPPLPSYLIRECLHLTLKYWTVRRFFLQDERPRVSVKRRPLTGEKQAREYPAAE